MDPSRSPSPPSPGVGGAEEPPQPPVDWKPVRVFISPVIPVAGDDTDAATVLPPSYTGVLYLHQRHDLPVLPPLMGLQPREDGDGTEKKREKWLGEMRGWLIVVAVLVASVTYQAGLSPPGGFWQQDSNDGALAGLPVLASTFPRRYAAFFYFNATAFLTSLAIIVLLMNETFYQSESKVVALQIIVVLDMVMLMGAFLVGSTRTVTTTIYTFGFAVVVLIFIYAVYTANFMSKLWGFIAGVLWARGDGAPPAVPDHIAVEEGANRPPDEVSRSK